jgi:hypothetical protein
MWGSYPASLQNIGGSTLVPAGVWKYVNVVFLTQESCHTGQCDLKHNQKVKQNNEHLINLLYTSIEEEVIWHIK